MGAIHKKQWVNFVYLAGQTWLLSIVLGACMIKGQLPPTAFEKEQANMAFYVMYYDISTYKKVFAVLIHLILTLFHQLVKGMLIYSARQVCS